MDYVENRISERKGKFEKFFHKLEQITKIYTLWKKRNMEAGLGIFSVAIILPIFGIVMSKFQRIFF